MLGLNDQDEALIPADDAGIRAYMKAQENKGLLRFLTCGSVDDGKSTLIGRLLYDTKLIFEDQLATLKNDTRKHGTTGEEFDFALLVDGLEAERQQGITIDVAYRFFATPARKFIVADTPGHEQYTRNMATGASTADVAVILIDARQGVLRQTRRHSFIVSKLGIRHVALAVNKIDLVDFSKEVFDRIVGEYRAFAAQLGFESITPIPLSARYGDNVTTPSGRMNWHHGPTLLAFLETVEVDSGAAQKPFRFPVQYVNRPNLDFRGFAGTVASGAVRIGDAVVAAKSGASSKVKRIVTMDGDLPEAVAGQSVTLVLEDEIEVARGNVLVPADHRPHVADQLAADLIWFDEEPLYAGRAYLLRTETDEIPATVTAIKHRTDVNTYAEEAVKALSMNEIGECNLSLQAPLAFDSYDDNRLTGAFVLIDRVSNATVAAGLIRHPLRRASNVHWQALDITNASRAEQKHQKPLTLWFTGLSGSGKSTIANLLDKKLFARGKHATLLDGDNVRHGLNRDLGFTEADRVENIRRVAEVARLMTEAGLITMVSFISPYRADRQMARERFPDGNFIEIFVDTPFEDCARRDPKGLYAKALKGEIKNFTGVDSPYEAPLSPDIHLKTSGREAADLVDEIEAWLTAKGWL
jgi:bifunctional enzyme CysN/CysC